MWYSGEDWFFCVVGLRVNIMFVKIICVIDCLVNNCKYDIDYVVEYRINNMK